MGLGAAAARANRTPGALPARTDRPGMVSRPERGQPTAFCGEIASTMRLNTSSSPPTPSTTVSWPCWR